jgi:hypothetical protein
MSNYFNKLFSYFSRRYGFFVFVKRLSMD